MVREENCCHHMGYSFLLVARVLLYAPSHRQNSTYHSLCCNKKQLNGSTMRDRSNNPSHHEQTLYKGVLHRTVTINCHRDAVGLECFFCVGRKEGNILFNDALNTFYLQLYGVRHIVKKDYSDSKI